MSSLGSENLYYSLRRDDRDPEQNLDVYVYFWAVGYKETNKTAKRPGVKGLVSDPAHVPHGHGGQEKRVTMLKTVSKGQRAIKGNFRKLVKTG